MGGGLMQLLAYGAQDVYLYNDSNYGPDIIVDNFNSINLNNLENTYNWYQYNRPIKKTDSNTECPITLEEINKSDSYCICNTCNTLFNSFALKKTLRVRNECPICLAEWNAKIEYVNQY
jgi:hypothetical protein